MVKRSFTPAEANKTLPLVQRIVADILAKASELRDGSVEPDRAAALQVELRELMRELASIGCEYKDWGFQLGLVDFPGRIDGQAVLLCWRSDEPSVAHYHLPGAGYAGRKPIPPELLVD